MSKIFNPIIIIFIYTLLTGCSDNKFNLSLSENDEIFYQTPPFKLETVSNGILISLDDIPDDVSSVFIEINNWGERTYTYTAGDYPQHRDMISSSITNIEGSCLEQLKKTKEIIFPFVRTGEKYNVSVVYIKQYINSASTPFIQITAENGIYPENNVELILNDNKTSVRLSDEPKFSSEVEYSEYAHGFSFTLFNDEMSSTMSSISTENNAGEISWDFESFFDEMTQPRKPDEGYKSGEYTAFIEYSVTVIYDDIIWKNYLIKSPRFKYRIK